MKRRAQQGAAPTSDRGIAAAIRMCEAISDLGAEPTERLREKDKPTDAVNHDYAEG